MLETIKKQALSLQPKRQLSGTRIKFKVEMYVERGGWQDAIAAMDGEPYILHNFGWSFLYEDLHGNHIPVAYGVTDTVEDEITGQ